VLHIVCFVITSDQTLEIKQEETRSLLKGLKIGKKKEKDKLQNNVGAHNSAHNQAQRRCEALLNQKQSIISTEKGI
jgi:hypothetical protein